MYAFCCSHFSYNEKRSLFISKYSSNCQNLDLPKVKRKLDLNDFAPIHQADMVQIL